MTASGVSIDGWTGLAASAGNLKKVTLELGGKSPNIIFADADLELAIPGAAAAIFLDRGEACTAGSRLFVHANVYDDVVARIADAALGILGDSLDPQSVMGPVVSQAQFNTVMGYVESGREQGAYAVAGGDRDGAEGYFVQPTVLVDTKPGMRVVDEEIFGPVLTVQKFVETEDFVRAANATAYGLAGGSGLRTSHLHTTWPES